MCRHTVQINAAVGSQASRCAVCMHTYARVCACSRSSCLVWYPFCKAHCSHTNTLTIALTRSAQQQPRFVKFTAWKMACVHKRHEQHFIIINTHVLNTWLNGARAPSSVQSCNGWVYCCERLCHHRIASGHPLALFLVCFYRIYMIQPACAWWASIFQCFPFFAFPIGKCVRCFGLFT